MGVRKPRPLRPARHISFQADTDSEGRSVAIHIDSDFLLASWAHIHNPRELRRLALWLNRAADWIDAHWSKT